jgi:translation initiation factor 3 subunit I
VWSYGNEFIIAGFDSGRLGIFNPHTGQLVAEKRDVHTGRINQLTFNRDKTLLITASKDYTAKIVDPRTLDVVKVFSTDRPVNGAVISPTLPHVILGGGQDAQSVTTTSASQGKFESKFYHMVYGDEFGRVKGHFGPINTMAIHPNGESFASGSEDGYVRLHQFDKNYLTMPSYVPMDVMM